MVVPGDFPPLLMCPPGSAWRTLGPQVEEEKKKEKPGIERQVMVRNSNVFTVSAMPKAWRGCVRLSATGQTHVDL